MVKDGLPGRRLLGGGGSRRRLQAEHPIARLREPADQPIRLDRIWHPGGRPSHGQHRIPLSSWTLRGRPGRTAGRNFKSTTLVSIRARDSAAAPRSAVCRPQCDRTNRDPARKTGHCPFPAVLGPWSALPLTMIKETLTRSFLWSAKPIGYPNGSGLSLRRVTAGCPRGIRRRSQANALVARSGFVPTAALVQRNTRRRRTWLTPRRR